MNESHELADEPPASRRGFLRSFVAPRPGQPTAFVAGIAVTLVAGAFIAARPTPQPPLTERDLRVSVERALASQVPGPPLSALVYEAIMPSIVLVRTERPIDTVARTSDPDGEGVGTGVVIAARGEVLTAWHVVDGSSMIELTFADGTTSPAVVAVLRPEDDIVILRPLDRPDTAVAATLGNPNALRIGNEAFVVGHPYGLVGSLSTGVISGLGRSFRRPGTGHTLSGLIQIDAAVNPGNSGGPLLNRSGHVTGVVTALLNPDEEVFIGIGLAVPIDVAAAAAGMPAY